MRNTRVTHDDNYVEEEDPDAYNYDHIIQLSSTM